MVRRTKKSRRRPKSMIPSVSRRRAARANRKTATLRIGRKKFSVKVTCRGRVRFTRAGRKSFNAQKRSLKVKCKVGRKRRVRTGARFASQKSTYNWL